jgi:hypothetical protein
MLRPWSVAFVASLTGCATPLTAPADDAVAARARPAIVKLRLRDVDMTIESSSRGPRFAVVARDGAFTERDLAAEDLAARHPELYQLYRSAVVRAPGAPYLDARLDLPERSGGRLPR